MQTELEKTQLEIAKLQLEQEREKLAQMQRRQQAVDGLGQGAVAVGGAAVRGGGAVLRYAGRWLLWGVVIFTVYAAANAPDAPPGSDLLYRIGYGAGSLRPAQTLAILAAVSAMAAYPGRWWAGAKTAIALVLCIALAGSILGRIFA